MSKSLVLLIVLVVVVIIVAASALFTVHQTEKALVLQFGDPKRVVSQPGLHFKTPFIQNVVKIDRRVLELNTKPEEVIAADQKRLVVDAFARYKIIDPLRYYITLQSSARAESRLTTLVSSGMRSILGKAPFVEVVRDGRHKLTRSIQALVNQQVADYGLEILDVRIRRADLPEANSRAIYRRMQTEREQEAAQIRAVGQEDAREIRASADKAVTVAVAEAERDSEIIRGQGDGCRNRIFARAFGADPDFFSFYRSMQSYERSLEGENTSLVLSPTGDFFRFFNSITPQAPPKPDTSNQRNVSDLLGEKTSLRTLICPELPAPQAPNVNNN